MSGGWLPAPSFAAAAAVPLVVPMTAFSSPYSDLLALLLLPLCFPGLKAADDALFTGVSVVAWRGPRNTAI